jgi:hypothetical protein
MNHSKLVKSESGVANSTDRHWNNRIGKVEADALSTDFVDSTEYSSASDHHCRSLRSI